MDTLPTELKTIIVSLTPISCRLVNKQFLGLSTKYLHTDVNLYRYIGYKLIKFAIVTSNLLLLEACVNMKLPSGKYFSPNHTLTKRIIRLLCSYTNSETIGIIYPKVDILHYGRKLFHKCCEIDNIDSILILFKGIERESVYPEMKPLQFHMTREYNYSLWFSKALSICILNSSYKVLDYLLDILCRCGEMGDLIEWNLMTIIWPLLHSNDEQAFHILMNRTSAYFYEHNVKELINLISLYESDYDCPLIGHYSNYVANTDLGKVIVTYPFPHL